MTLSSSQLEAFLAILRAGSFLKAAKNLRIGQPAISQRIKLLESSLKTTLFERSRKGIVLTQSGRMLFDYCQNQQLSEGELVRRIIDGNETLSGTLRIAAPSTLAGPVGLASFRSTLRAHPHVHLEVVVCTLSEISELLTSGKVDFTLQDEPIHQSRIENIHIGYEIYRAFHNSKHPAKKTIFFDTSESDRLTERYFAAYREQTNDKAFTFERRFTGDVNVMIEAVRMGIGYAVLPIHFVPNDRSLSQIKKYTVDYKEPVYLSYRKSEFLPALFKVFINELRTLGPKLLKN